jgi:two-component system NtrC family sensor kinase
VRILVVDDDRLGRLLLADRLRSAGHEVTAAASVAEGRQHLAGADVVICDMVMPGEPGLTLLAEANDGDRAVVMVTGKGSATHDDQLEAMRRGAYDVLHKGDGEAMILAAVARAAERVRLGRENRELLERQAVRARELAGENERLEREVESRAGMIARAKAEWEQTFDAIRDPIVVLDVGMRVVRANRAYAERAHADIRRVPGTRCHETLFHRSDPCPGCPVGSLTGEGVGCSDLGDGGRTLRAHAFAASAGRCAHVVHYRDITDQRILEARLAESSRLAAVGKLAGGVAHEVNNPMAFIAANVRSVRETLEDVKSFLQGGAGDREELRILVEDATAALDEAGVGVERVRKIVQGLKAFADDRALVAHPIALADSLDRALRRSQPRPGMLISWTGRAGRRAMGDPGRLDEAFVEIVKNALQACEGRAGASIRLRTWEDDGRICAEVADDGPGMPAEVVARIFEPFYTTHDIGGGTGMGLTIAHGVVRQLGGDIRVESEVGRGTRVVVRLPAASEGAEGRTAEASA